MKSAEFTSDDLSPMRGPRRDAERPVGQGHRRGQGPGGGGEVRRHRAGRVPRRESGAQAFCRNDTPPRPGPHGARRSSQLAPVPPQGRQPAAQTAKTRRPGAERSMRCSQYKYVHLDTDDDFFTGPLKHRERIDQLRRRGLAVRGLSSPRAFTGHGGISMVDLVFERESGGVPVKIRGKVCEVLHKQLQNIRISCYTQTVPRG